MASGIAACCCASEAVAHVRLVALLSIARCSSVSSRRSRRRGTKLLWRSSQSGRRKGDCRPRSSARRTPDLWARPRARARGEIPYDTPLSSEGAAQQIARFIVLTASVLMINCNTSRGVVGSGAQGRDFQRERAHYACMHAWTSRSMILCLCLCFSLVGLTVCYGSRRWYIKW